MNCTGDSCEVDVTDYDKVAEVKLQNWMRQLEPMDFDAPGSTVRESGV